MGFTIDGSPHGETELGAELRLDEPISTKCLLRIVRGEVGFTTGGGNPHRSQRCRTSPWRRSRELLYRRPQSLAHDGNRWKCDKTIVVVVMST
jgi:hypothetical protein